MKNKICVYAICKNELQNITRWLNSMSEADYIVVLDTGSTDGTYEQLQKEELVTRVEQKVIKPWRFDVARNESMKLVPDDANILVCTDLDEIFESGWGQILRDNWTEQCTMCHYLYAWSHNEVGEPGDVFVYNKIHTRDYHWHFPVHEVLLPNVPVGEGFEEYILDAGDNIYLHHLQDKSKSRSNYLDLLKLSCKENPNDAHVRMLLAREYLLINNRDLALKEYLKVIEMPDAKERDIILLESYGRLANLYFDRDDDGNGLKYCSMFIELNNTYREPYFIMAEYYMRKQQYALAKAIIETGFSMSTQKFTWVERAPMWQDLGYKMLGECCYRLGNIDAAFDNFQTALELNNSDPLTLRFMVDIIKQMKNGINGEKNG